MRLGVISHKTFPTELILCAWRHRGLLFQLTRREVTGRYKGSYLGAVWAFFTPLAMLAVYTFFFGVVLKSRWGNETEGTTGFAITLFAGLIVFNLFGEVISRAPSLILSNANYVKKVVFPLEILSWATLLGALFHFLVSFCILLAAHGLASGNLSWSLLLLPLILIPYSLILLGLCWFLSATGAYLRDIGQVVGSIQMALLFLSPVFYPAATLGPNLQFWLNLNPLTFAIETFRGMVLSGLMPDWLQLGWYWLLGLATSWSGFVWFQKTRKGFSDVL